MKENIVGVLQPVFIIASALVGIGFGLFTDGMSAWITEAFLMCLLYTLFLTIDFTRLRNALGNLRFTAAALSINFVITPIVAWILGLGFFGDSPEMCVGLMMLLVTPCTDWYLVFTGIGKGNVELGMSVLPLNLILQCVLLPVYLSLFYGEAVSLDVASLLIDMAIVLLIPLTLSVITKRITNNRPRFTDFVSRKGDTMQLTFLCIAVIAMFASEGREVTENPQLLLEMFIPLVIFFLLAFCLARLVGTGMRFGKPDTVSLTFTCMARNSPLALAIAVAAFPDIPLISLALVIGPLIELPILSLAAWKTSRWVSDGTPGN